MGNVKLECESELQISIIFTNCSFFLSVIILVLSILSILVCICRCCAYAAVCADEIEVDNQQVQEVRATNPQDNRTNQSYNPMAYNPTTNLCYWDPNQQKYVYYQPENKPSGGFQNLNVQDLPPTYTEATNKQTNV